MSVWTLLDPHLPHNLTKNCLTVTATERLDDSFHTTQDRFLPIPLLSPHLITGLPTQWHACPKWHMERFPWHAAFTVVPIFFISVATPASPYCAEHVYKHTRRTAYRRYKNYHCYQITLQWNIFTQIGAVRSVDWVFTVGAPAWRWLGEYVTLGRTFYSLVL